MIKLGFPCYLICNNGKRCNSRTSFFLKLKENMVEDLVHKYTRYNSVDEFLDRYTYDEVEIIYMDLISRNITTDEEIIESNNIECNMFCGN